MGHMLKISGTNYINTAHIVRVYFSSKRHAILIKLINGENQEYQSNVSNEESQPIIEKLIRMIDQ